MRKSDRLFQLTNILRKHQPITAKQLAQKLMVSERTIYRYVDDWSNPEMPEDALIAAVIERELFEDVCLVCLHFGFDRVESIYARLVADKSLSEVTSSIPRMLENIKRGFDATD